MPAVSAKQKRFMDAAAHNPSFAKKAGISQDVAQEFSEKSKGLKFGSGSSSRPDLQKINKPSTRHGKTALMAGGGMAESKAMVKKEVAFMKKKGAPASMVKHEESEMKKMAKGGITTAKMGAVKTAAPSRDGVATKGKTKGKMVHMSGSKPLGMKYGGKAKSC
jgi:hypothetical protein